MKTKLLAAAAILAFGVLGMNAVGATGTTASVPHTVTPSRDASVIRVADLFGESDEEKAARKAHEDGQDAQIRALNDKVRDLQDAVSRLTGQNEELSHRIGEFNEKIDRQQKDFEYRLCALAAQQLGTGTSSGSGQGDPNAVPCPGGMGGGMSGGMSAAPQTAPAMPPPQTIAPRSDAGAKLAPPPGVLGTLPAGKDGAGPAPAAAANDDAVHAQYSAAMGLLAKARYDDARAAFRTFADANPNSDLTPIAVYWIGDIAYVQKDYDSAERSFAEVIRKYPTSPRAPDSILKLGQSLLAAGQKKEGCTALAALPAKYPKAAKNLLAQGADARKGAGCKAES